MWHGFDQSRVSLWFMKFTHVKSKICHCLTFAAKYTAEIIPYDQKRTYMCPIKGAVDIEDQYVWQGFNDTSKSYELVPVLSSESMVPIGSHYQLFHHDGISSSLVTGQSSAKFRCVMPDHEYNGCENQTVWYIDVTISNSKHGKVDVLWGLVNRSCESH